MKVINLPQNIIKTPAEYRRWMKEMMPLLFKEPSGLENINLHKKTIINSRYNLHNSPEHNLFLADAIPSLIQSSLKLLITDFNKIYERITNMSNYEFSLFKKAGAGDFIKKRTLQALNFDTKDNKHIRITYSSFDELLKVIIFDSNKSAQRGYLIEDGKKLIKNFDIRYPNSAPNVLLYADKKYIDAISGTLHSDLNNILLIMSEIKKYL